MGIVKRARDLEGFFKRRSFILDSPGVRSERLKDGRVQLHARRTVSAPFVQVPPPRIITSVTLEGHFGPTGLPPDINLGPYTWHRIDDAVPITEIGQFKPATPPIPYPGTGYFDAGVDFQNFGFRAFGQFKLWGPGIFGPPPPPPPDPPESYFSHAILSIFYDETASQCYAQVDNGGGGFGFGPFIDISSGHFDDSRDFGGITGSVIIDITWNHTP